MKRARLAGSAPSPGKRFFQKKPFESIDDGQAFAHTVRVMKNNVSEITATATATATAVENPQLVKIEATMTYKEFIAIRVSIGNDLRVLNDILSENEDKAFWEETIAKVKKGLTELDKSYTFV